MSLGPFSATTGDAVHNIVVIGGGFAGSATDRRLQDRLPTNYRLVLLSEESYTTFHPLLAEVVGATIFPEQVVAPLRQVIRPSYNARFIMGRVGQIDLGTKTVHCNSLAGDITIPYEHVVLVRQFASYGFSARIIRIRAAAEDDRRCDGNP